ncbi:MAG: DUF4347 domain-containing protein [Cyanobacteria bacterium P01_G01_bin.54]
MSHSLKSLGLCSLLCGCLSLGQPAQAQNITAALDGTGTVITIDGNTYQIEGGTQAGANLFHSFQEFGLSANEIAHFLSRPEIQNVLGRVVGGDPSVIEGLIRLSGGDSNLYLINPAGLVFTQGASLDVPGSFTATTATRLDFGEGFFNALGENDYATLTGEPLGFVFDTQTGLVVNEAALEVAAGESLWLLGGTVLSTGTVAAPQGNVTIAAIPGANQIKITPEGSLLSLVLDVVPATAGNLPESLPGELGIQPVDLPRYLTGEVDLAQGDVGIASSVEGETVQLMAAGDVLPSNPALVKGKTTVVRFPGAQDDLAYTFIDSRADDPLALLYGGVTGTISTLLERDENGVAVIRERLAAIQAAGETVEAVNVIAEGYDGELWLGNQRLTAANVSAHEAELRAWAVGLSESADLLLYSCFTALGEGGESFVAALARLTGADVAASVDATGSESFGGDWELEYRVGDVAAAVPIEGEVLATWEGKLATRTVENVNDSGALSLRGQIGAAEEGDTVAFDIAGSPIITLNGEIAWSTDNLTIDGANVSGENVVVDGGGNGRVFHIGHFSITTNATIKNLTIQNGTASGLNPSGGAISHRGSGNLLLERMTILGNSSEWGGGGLFSDGTVMLVDSEVSENFAGWGGGGIHGNGQVSLVGSEVSGNQSSGLNGGGGIKIFGDSLIVENSIISDNSSRGAGGGIWAFDSSISMTNSQILDNTSDFSGGGGILSSGDNASTITLINSKISGNESIGWTGGGIFSSGSSTIELINSEISNNISQSGGGIRSRGDVNVSDSIISGNLGGGIQILGETSLTLNRAIVSGNTSERSHGGITSNSVILTNSRVSNNSSRVGVGGIYAEFFVSESSTIVGNSSEQNVGGIRASSVSITNSIVELNSSSSNHTSGGGILGKEIEITDSIVSHNSGNRSGGGIAGNLVKVVGSIISGNSASHSGGGIYSNSVNLTNSIVELNVSDADNNGAGDGGGIWGESIKLIDSVVFGNSTNHSGGGIHGVLVTSINSTISGNSASHGGGGIHAGELSITNSTVVLNAADIDNNGGGDGGGVFITGTQNSNIANTIIANNTDLGGEGPDIGANLLGSTIQNSLIGDITGISFNAPTHDVNGNLVNVDPLLAPLGDYGGSTPTHALLPGSPALNAGNNALARDANGDPLTTDQRGQARISDSIVDIGAFESRGFTLSLNSGDNQTTTVDTAFTNPLTVSVRSDFGEPVAGGQITFNAAQNGPSLNTLTQPITLDANGTAALTATANTIAGSHTVTATAPGLDPVAFNLTNRPDVVATLSALSILGGNHQSATVATPFAATLQLQALDQFNNPVADANITFSAPNSGASGTATTPSVTTDASGIASTSFTANTVAGSYAVAANAESVPTTYFDLTNTPDVTQALAVYGFKDAIAPGETSTFSVRAQDRFGNPTPTFASAVNFTSSDPQAELPGVAYLTNGFGRFSATLHTLGEQSLTVNSFRPTGSQTGILVSNMPAPAPIAPPITTPSPVTPTLPNLGDPISPLPTPIAPNPNAHLNLGLTTETAIAPSHQTTWHASGSQRQVYTFNNVATGRWSSAPPAASYTYQMADNALFTGISGFPPGTNPNAAFRVVVNGQTLGEFSPGERLSFSDYAHRLGNALVNGVGVSQFMISNLNEDEPVFSIQLDFNQPSADFTLLGPVVRD